MNRTHLFRTIIYVVSAITDGTELAGICETLGRNPKEDVARLYAALDNSEAPIASRALLAMELMLRLAKEQGRSPDALEMIQEMSEKYEVDKRSPA